MAVVDQERLLVVIEARTDQLLKELNKANRAIRSSGQEMRRSIGSADAALIRFAARVAAPLLSFRILSETMQKFFRETAQLGGERGASLALAWERVGLAFDSAFVLGDEGAEQMTRAIDELAEALDSPEFRAFVQTIGVGLVRALQFAIDDVQQFAQDIENMRASIEDLGQGVAGRAETLTDAITGGPTAEQRLDRAHEASLRAARDLELLAELKERAAEQPDILVAGRDVNNAAERIGASFEVAAQGAELYKGQAQQADQITGELTDRQEDAARAADKAAAAMERERERLQALRDANAQLVSDLEFEVQLNKLNEVDQRVMVELRRLNAQATDEQRAAIEALVRQDFAEDEANQRLIDSLDQLRSASESALSAFNSELQEGEGFADALNAALKNVLQSIIRIAEQQAIAALFGQTGTAGGGLFGGLFGSLFGGARQMGGPVSPGRAFLVGERGPEMFVPRGPGSIVANNRLSIGGAINIVTAPSPLFQQQVNASIMAYDKGPNAPARQLARLSAFQARYG